MTRSGDGQVVVRPVTREGVVAHVVGRVPGDGRRVVVVDGAAATGPGELADALVAPLRAAGRAVVRVRVADFLRPASLRFEHGRHDPDAYLEDRVDVRALEREVLTPFAASGRYLPTLWDPVTDRATRAPYAQAPEGAVLVLDGDLLLGLGLAADLTVHLAVRPATLARRTPEEDAWVLPAFARYADEVGPEVVADVVVRADDPAHPALVDRGP
ncbi:uridine kinase [Cellulomonas fimi]|uniref:uridine kinase n=1 Tax=Cellulomonas fimi TaxID=1708 RepID=UPI00234C8053|nr:uridine kinase [Cellulomonas fimi]MDC7122017.1 uridine kinase [Cellulomonas fimi]